MYNKMQSEQPTEGILTEIREANLSYLMLAQKMIRTDKSAAQYRLGISQSIADLIDSFSTMQMIKLASASVMLTRFRFDDELILGIVSNYQKPAELSAVHSTILLSNQVAETIS